ncbi:MAG: hypothetical protein ACYTE3_09555, partial [Planctomycetota bacterium]
EDKKWGPASEANTRLLSDMCKSTAPGPYHLINTNIILVDSQNPQYRGRGGDNFILSPLYCGSNATEWCETTDFLRGMLTLSTAMAISGAAINPHTGAAGKGPSRNKLVSFLMTVLNLRLGYWVTNPGKKGSRLVPNYFWPGLKGLLGVDFHEDAHFVELSDGGHFDNTGLYELIRRKVKTIIVSDGGADPECAFSDLANAIERVRVDFGVNIRFEDSSVGLEQMLPRPAGKSAFHDKYNLAKNGFAVGTIEYPEVGDGTIFYLKTILTEGLPPDIYGYKSSHPTFPDQSTADQFFDESQFEAYREIGYRIAIEMLEYDINQEQLLLQRLPD